MNTLENTSIEIIQNETDKNKKIKDFEENISELQNNFKQPNIQRGKGQKKYLKEIKGQKNFQI